MFDPDQVGFNKVDMLLSFILGTALGAGVIGCVAIGFYEEPQDPTPIYIEVEPKIIHSLTPKSQWKANSKVH